MITPPCKLIYALKTSRPIKQEFNLIFCSTEPIKRVKLGTYNPS